MLGVLVLPFARRMLLPVIMQTIIRLPGSHTTMNSRIRGSSSSLAPSKRKISSRNNQHSETSTAAMVSEM